LAFLIVAVHVLLFSTTPTSNLSEFHTPQQTSQPITKESDYRLMFVPQKAHVTVPVAFVLADVIVLTHSR
jgi:hypothetical protein